MSCHWLLFLLTLFSSACFWKAQAADAGYSLSQEVEKKDEEEHDPFDDSSDDDSSDDDDEDEDGVTVITEKNFNETLKSNERVLVEFYAPWCGHCKQLEPELSKAAKQLKSEGLKTVVGKVDCIAEVNLDLVTRENITAFPIVKYFVKGGFQEQVDHRSADAIAAFLRKQEQRTVQSVSQEEVEKEDSFLWKFEYTLIGYVKKKSSQNTALQKAYEILSDNMELPVKVVRILLPKSADAKADAQIKLFRRDFKEPDSKFIEYLGTSWLGRSIVDWVVRSSYPLVATSLIYGRYSSEAIQQIPDFKGLGSVNALMDDKEQGLKIMPIFLKLAAANPRWKFLVIPITDLYSDGQPEGLLTNMAVKKTDKLTITILHKGRRYSIKPDRMKIEETLKDDVSSLLEEIVAGTGDDALLSADPPTKEIEGGLLTLTARSFERHVMNPKKDVFVMFSLPGCKACEDSMPHVKAVAKQIDEQGFGGRGVQVAKLDCANNQCPDYITGYPEFILYPAVHKDRKHRKRVVYNGAETAGPTSGPILGTQEQLFNFVTGTALNLEDMDVEEELAQLKKSGSSIIDREKKKKQKKKQEL